ncbi:MAG: hypothetical protein HeimC3_32210 [Candidatus Heimdallarchaeota archaeon LC_3]|nr:MAG: hypothetical protein HeimC3_32210 [Candidatus Heimdallarchaeota archaeon LC_3]
MWANGRTNVGSVVSGLKDAKIIFLHYEGFLNIVFDVITFNYCEELKIRDLEKVYRLVCYADEAEYIFLFINNSKIRNVPKKQTKINILFKKKTIMNIPLSKISISLKRKAKKFHSACNRIEETKPNLNTAISNKQ